MWILEISRQGQLQTETLFIQTGRYFGVPMVAFCLEYILKNTLMLLCDIVFVPHESSLLLLVYLHTDSQARTQETTWFCNKHSDISNVRQ